MIPRVPGDRRTTLAITVAVGVLLAGVVYFGFREPATAADPAWPRTPDPALTPGATLPADTATICKSGYSASVRHVSRAQARTVFAAYHVPYAQHARGELDHLIPLALAGSNDLTNLWPQLGSRPNHKDVQESSLHRQVCRGVITLAEAQRLIVDPVNWT